jgi:hypothetical protein
MTEVYIVSVLGWLLYLPALVTHIIFLVLFVGSYKQQPFFDNLVGWYSNIFKVRLPNHHR